MTLDDFCAAYSGIVAPALLGNTSAKERVSVLDFIPAAQHAAIRAGTSTFDCQPGIQAAIDYAIYITKQEVYLPAGRYPIGKTLHLGYGFSYTAAHLYGDGKAYSGSSEFCGTTIAPTFSDAPAISIQGGRGAKVSDLTIVGLNRTHILTNGLGAVAAPAINDLDVANWVSPTLHPNAASRYAPYCGIAIDGYSGAAPAVCYPPVAYPSFLPSTQYGKVPTSEVLIDNVGISGFVVAVAIKPSNADGNADYTRLTNCLISECIYGVSVGHTQSRLVDLFNTNSVACHTVLTTKAHGLQNGKGAFRLNGCEPGGCIQLIDANSSLGGPCIFENVYAESIYRIGNYATTAASGGAIEFIGCAFALDLQGTRGVPKSLLDVSNSAVAWRGVELSGGRGTHHIVGGNEGVFENVVNVAAGPNLGTVQPYRAHALNATFGITFGTQKLTFNAQMQGIRLVGAKNLDTGVVATTLKLGAVHPTSRAAVIPLHARWMTPGSGPGPMVPAPAGTAANVVVGTAFDLVQTGGEVVATLIVPYAPDVTYNARGMNPGDLVIHDRTNTVFYIRSRVGSGIAMVAQNNTDGAGNLLEPITGGNFYFYICRAFAPSYSTLASLTAGNAVLTGASRDDGYAGHLATDLQQGDALMVMPHADNFVTSAHTVAAVDAVAKTITLSGGVNKTGTRTLERFIRKAPANT